MSRFHLRKQRSTDATGCFWAFACMFGAMLYGQISPIVGFFLLLVSPACFVWQIGKWWHDARLLKHAKEWCQLNYAQFSQTAILDFATSFSHCTGIDIRDCAPFTPLFCFICLDEFKWIDDEDLLEFGESIYGLPDQPHADLLLPILQDAKLLCLPLQEFRGDTLHAVIEFVAKNTAR